MAESLPVKNIGSILSNVSTENITSLECAVCLQNCVHPAELPCGHVFCYLCIKGIVNQGRRCAMCRQDIPTDFLDKPRLLVPVENDAEPKAFEDGHYWFYEGHNGWWQYDERTSLELETAYQNGDGCCELLIAGFLYVADFDSMLQYRRNDPCRRRRIKRDLATTNKKGVAGLKLTKESGFSSSSSMSSNVLAPVVQNLNTSNRPVPDLLSQSRGTIFTRQGLIRNRSLNLHISDRNRREGFRPRRHSLAPAHYHLNEAAQDNVENEVDTEDSFYWRNVDLDNVIHDTLDWTIQQIESLQLELSNDYENLSQDVNHYERLQNTLHLSRTNSERTQSRRAQASDVRLNRSLEHELDATDRVARSRLNRSEENVSSIERNRFHPRENNSHLQNFRSWLLFKFVP